MKVYGQSWDNLKKKEDQDHKVKTFIIDNPVSAAFLKREKGKLRYSVFKPTNDTVSFYKSAFKGRPPTVFVEYPSYVSQPTLFTDP